MNVNLNKFRSFAEETCNMQHNSAEADHSSKEIFTRLATTDSSPLELMQDLWILTNSEAALKKHTNAAHDSVEALKVTSQYTAFYGLIDSFLRCVYLVL